MDQDGAKIHTAQGKSMKTVRKTLKNGKNTFKGRGTLHKQI